jgi:ATP-dependent Clp protease ATP-binding subunit ClpC
VFERFTDRARKSVVLAQEEARMLRHSWIGTEHLLLGLLHEGGGVGARALEQMGLSLEEVRREVTAVVGPGPGVEGPVAHIPFTPRAKKVMELSLREAIGMGHNYIGTEHLLLALMREGEGIAAQVLQKRGLDLGRVRATVVELLSGYRPIAVGGETDVEPSTEYEASERAAESARAQAETRFPTCPNCSASLIEWLRTRAIDAEGVGRVTIAYCGVCGVAIGTVP